MKRSKNDLFNCGQGPLYVRMPLVQLRGAEELEVPSRGELESECTNDMSRASTGFLVAVVPSPREARRAMLSFFVFYVLCCWLLC